MAKQTSVKIKLESTAGTGYYYVTKKNSRTMTDKMVVNNYDPVARKHVLFKEGKNKISLEVETLDQINSLKLEKDIPILIADADEVIFLF